MPVRHLTMSIIVNSLQFYWTKKKGPLYCRLLPNMYLIQKRRIQWDNNHCLYIKITSGVKQSGDISPILFGIYMHGLLNELEKSSIGYQKGL